MSGATVLAAARAETRPCVIDSCDEQLPVRVSCVPRGDGMYSVVTDIDQERLVEHLASHRRSDRESLTVAAVLAVCIFGALLFLAAITVGQHAMCAAHSNQLAYCSGFDAQKESVR